MSVITPYIDNLLKIEGKLEEIAVEIIKNNKEQILYYNKEMQLKKGLNAQGKDVAKNYAQSTQDHWRYKNPPKNPSYKVTSNKYDFDWSGQLQDQMYIDIKKEGTFSIFSYAAKATLLNTLYGDLFGLTKENNEMVNTQIILPNLHKYILMNMFKL